MSTFSEALFILDKSLENLENKVQQLLQENHLLVIRENENKDKKKEFIQYKEKTLKELYTLREVIKNEMAFDIKKSSLHYAKKDYQPNILMSNE